MIYYIIIILAIILTIHIVNLSIKDKLDLGFSLFWALFSIFAVIFSFNITKIEKIANFVGVLYPPSLAFTLFIGFLCLYVLQLSIIISKQNKKIIKLTQKLSILEEKANYKERSKNGK